MEELVATMPSRPFGATAVDIRCFSRRKLSTSGYSAAEKRLSRRDARISVTLCDCGLCESTLKGYVCLDGKRAGEKGVRSMEGETPERSCAMTSAVAGARRMPSRYGPGARKWFGW